MKLLIALGVALCRGKTLIATTRPISVCTALKTCPMPPLPIESITRYDVNSHQSTGYEVDVNILGGANSVATLRGVCDFQKS